MTPPIIRLLRPRQWIKNGFVIAPIFFSLLFENIEAWQLTLSAAFAFAFASSAVYILNDWYDRDEDRLHPKKRKRPLAAGQVSIGTALFVAACCAIGSASLLTLLPPECASIIAIYVVLNIFYTLVLKKQALLDVFFIGGCFVLRVLMGCFALSVVISPWIILTTFMLALFLGFGKRYHELGVEGYAEAKQNLQHYSRELLDKLVIICGGSALVSYSIYAAEFASDTGDIAIVYTVGFVAFGLFRYLQSIYVYGKGGEPESIIIRDKWQWVNMILWLSFTLWALG
jgi:4-hydroxybenzoate polyprenyltransferase